MSIVNSTLAQKRHSINYENNYPNFWIDIARVIATFLVIVNHVNEQLNFTVINNSTIVFQFVGGMGVPIFLGITGYIMINRNYTNKLKIERFSKNNLIPIVYSSVFWTIILALYSYFNMLSNTDELLKNLILQQ
ncbi:acyltransferase family protein [Leuconostoc suionicum]|uniref:acyltransferase family protein n=1 Tax=Leuconostoc suionicum TaxID=1511761 RepID=UPI001B8C6347|nr:acyltransferase family protein [Leuconostoc suionicum]